MPRVAVEPGSETPCRSRFCDDDDNDHKCLCMYRLMWDGYRDNDDNGDNDDDDAADNKGIRDACSTADIFN